MDIELGRRLLDLIDEYRVVGDSEDYFEKSPFDADRSAPRTRDDVARDFADALGTLLGQVERA